MNILINMSLTSSISDSTIYTENSEQSTEENNIKPIIFKGKEEYYYYMIDSYFVNVCNTNNIVKMISIINGNKSKQDNKFMISLRILDWFATKYSKKYIMLNDSDDTFDVRISYKAQLKSYKKRYFDPFRRNGKFVYTINKDNQQYTILTTLGQLNFFKWVFTKNILMYVEHNLYQITNEMNQNNKDDKKKEKKIVKIKSITNNNNITCLDFS